MNVPFALDLDLQPLGDRVDSAHADAVQARRDLVAGVVELAAGVQDGVHDLGCAHPLLVHPTGMPRPLSSTVTEPSKWIVTSILEQ